MNLSYPHPEHQYLDLLEELLDGPADFRPGRNGNTYSVFGRQLRFDLGEGFPLLTTKRVFFRAVVEELLWLLSGSTNAKPLEDKGIEIWREWGDPKTREMGRIYGAQWRAWRGTTAEGFCCEIDQIAAVIDSLKNDPFGRRHIVTAWNPAEIADMALPPCHAFFQFDVADGRLSCMMTQRSCDIFLGVPFNIAYYALLTHLIAREVGLGVGELILSLGDTHLYETHTEAAREQLSRREWVDDFPRVTIAQDAGGIFDITAEDIILRDYAPRSAIKAKVSA